MPENNVVNPATIIDALSSNPVFGRRVNLPSFSLTVTVPSFSTLPPSSSGANVSSSPVSVFLTITFPLSVLNTVPLAVSIGFVSVSVGSTIGR
jgi:hypothetical protein